MSTDRTMSVFQKLGLSELIATYHLLTASQSASAKTPHMFECAAAILECPLNAGTIAKSATCVNRPVWLAAVSQLLVRVKAR